jgi:hypothetical protein
MVDERAVFLFSFLLFSFPSPTDQDQTHRYAEEYHENNSRVADGI